jgi:hypothetical protein
MIIWSGKGFWIAVITFGCLLLAELRLEGCQAMLIPAGS